MRRSAELLGLDPALYRVDGISDEGTHHKARVSRVGERERCPKCGGAAVAHGTAKATACHAPLMGKPTVVELAKRRLRCKRCGATFWEAQPMLSALSPHLSAACEGFALRRLAEGATMARVEHECGASRNILAKAEAAADVRCRRLPVHLCIDEVRAFPRRVAARRGGPHMAACVYDAEARTLCDMVPGAEAADVAAWLEGFDELQLRRVETVSCDLKDGFVRLARESFPNALVYADKFHVSKLVVGAVDKERRDLCRKARVARDACGKKSDAWKARDAELRLLRRAGKLLLARRGALAPAQAAVAAEALRLEGVGRLRAAYLALQMFYEWSDAGFGGRDEMDRALTAWVARCRDVRMPEGVRSAAKAVKDKKEHVLNGWETGRTNAVAEALNRSIKDTIRECRGFNGFEALRRRCLIRLGRRREPNAPIPLFARGGKKGGGRG